MIIIHFFALSGLCVMGACFVGLGKKRPDIPAGWIVSMFGLALALRLIASALSVGFPSDTACFSAWANRICETGPMGFYSKDVFTDYPPGYIYILWPIGMVYRALGLEYCSAPHLLLLKLPSVLSDMACGVLLYRETQVRTSKSQACFLCAAYLFNPAIFLNSAVWGQVDSLTALIALIVCICLTRQRLYPAYIAYGMGILIKPQILFLSPVLLLGTVHWIWADRKALLPRFLHCLFRCLSVALGGVILCLPFGISTVLEQMTSTLASYPYASMNAYNLWSLLGLNLVSQDEAFLGVPYHVFGMAAVIVTIVLTLLLGWKKRKGVTSYPFLAAFTISYIFLFSVRMHERYLYPALALLLLAYVYRPLKLTYLCYAAFSIMHFYNTADVLYFYDPASIDRKALTTLLPALGMVMSGILLGYISYRYYRHDTGSGKGSSTLPSYGGALPGRFSTGTKPAASRKSFCLGKADFFWMCAITALYGCFALYDLGDRTAPATAFDMAQGESVTLEFQEKAPSEVSYYIAPWQQRSFTLEGKWEADAQWAPLGEVSLQNVFTWQKASLDASAPYLRLTLASDQASLLELVFLDESGQILVPGNAGDYPALFDEQTLYPENFSFRSGMYFDEIYHGRTAYEFLHGLTAYENTHPPMGKILISLGVALFGMNPFGWRIIGALFGIIMSPVMYLFAKRLTENTSLAALACALFSFDFMHFTQTRIATIDVYVTFFVLLMYFFLYWYSTLSFYDTPLWKTWIPLGACGVCMGFGIASKWTGIYAGAGLAVLFFPVLYRRYREYLYAKMNPKGKSNGILHAHVIDSFRKNTLRTIYFCLVFFVAVPGVIYLLSYLPFRDYGGRGLLSRLLYNQTTMFSYHSNLDATHSYSSIWYEWPLIKRPIWYYSRIVTGVAGSGGLREGISAFGNPAVWWPGIPASLYMLYLWAAKKDKKAAFLTVGYLAQYLPWFFVTRVTFIYHYFPSVAFVVLMIVHGLRQWKGKGARRRLPVAAALYGLAAFGLFLLFYPVLSGQPIEASFVAKYLRWFESWVLVAR